MSGLDVYVNGYSRLLVLVGTQRTPPNCFLEYVSNVPSADRLSRHLLYALEERKEVRQGNL